MFAALPNVIPASVEIERDHVQPAFSEPFSLGRRTEDAGHATHRIVVRFQPLRPDEAEAVIAFLGTLDGMMKVFTFDLTPWWRGASPAPGSRTFRLMTPADEWESDLTTLWRTGLEAVEAQSYYGDDWSGWESGGSLGEYAEYGDDWSGWESGGSLGEYAEYGDDFTGWEDETT